MELINFRVNDKTEQGGLIDKVYEHLGLPESTFLGTRITKKMLIDNNELSGHDKKLVTDIIQSIEWRNTLKPDTLNIPTYVTDTVEYIEIAVIRVVLKTDEKYKGKLTKIAKLLHSLIPYPVVLLVEISDEVAISLADKRINQADKSKLVIKHIYTSNWLSACEITDNENAFLNDFALKNASSTNYFELYQGLISMLIAFEVSCISGDYRANNIQVNSSSLKFVEKNNEDKTTLLHKLANLEADLAGIRNKLKKETQMNQKMQLNLNAKKIKHSISNIKSSLY